LPVERDLVRWEFGRLVNDAESSADEDVIDLVPGLPETVTRVVDIQLLTPPVEAFRSE
jgi:hypothetical protein